MRDSFLPIEADAPGRTRMKEVEIPVFPGYLFCRFDAADPYRVLNSPGGSSTLLAWD
jgi:hypothetical protein